MNQPPKEPSFLGKLFNRRSNPPELNSGSSSQRQSFSSLPNNTTESRRWGFRTSKSKKGTSATSTPALGSSSSSSPFPALAQASISALSLRPSSGHSNRPPSNCNRPGPNRPGLSNRPCIDLSTSSPCPPGPAIATSDSVALINKPIPDDVFLKNSTPPTHTDRPSTAAALPAPPIAITDYDSSVRVPLSGVSISSGPISDPPVPPDLELSIALRTPSSDSPPQSTCTRTCIIWRKSLEIAGQKLLKLKLPPLDHGHLKKCSHEPGHGEAPVNNTVASNIQDLQTTIEEKHPAGSGSKGMERMKDLLQTFSKYAAIVDVAVQHSPQITALVWAGIRLTLQVTLNSIETRESLETVAGTLTEKTAICEFYASLYMDTQSELCADSDLTTDSLRRKLEDALPELYAAVLVCSVKARQYFTAHIGKKIAFMLKPFTLEFQPLLEEVLKWEKEVKECGDMAIMQTILASSQNLQEMRPLLNDIESKVAEIMEFGKQILEVAQENLDVTKDIRQAILKEDEKKILQLLDLLSPLEPQKRHQDVRSTRLKNTGTWLLQHHRFQKWLESDGTGETHSDRILCCYGLPGAGKTVMSSIVIDHLTSQFTEHEQDQVVITCIYCDYRDQGNQTLVNLLGSLLKQFLTMGGILHVPDRVRSVLEETERKGKKVETTDIIDMVKLTLPQFRRSFICIDALDELQPDVRKALLNTLYKDFTTSDRAVQLFLTGRPHIPQEVNESLRITQDAIDVIANGDDIRAYLINQIALDTSPTAMNESLKEVILHTIVEKSEGMFLLPSLHIRIVLEGATIKQRRQALKTLPSTLGASFTSMIERIKKLPPAHAKLGMQVLLWLHLAYRPLKLRELQHALAVELGDTELDEENIPSREVILNCCLGLVIVDEETSTVRFVHYTLEEFFKDSNNATTYFPDRYTVVSEICLTYLNYGDVSAPCTLKRGPRWAKGTNRALVDDGSKNQNPAGNNLAGNDQADDVNLRMRKFAFLKYAACHWGHYVRLQSHNADSVTKLALKLLLRVEDESYAAFEVVYQTSLDKYRFFNFLRAPVRKMLGTHVAAFFGLANYMSTLAGVQGWDAKDHNEQTPLTVAARNGHVEFVRLLLEREEVFVNSIDNESKTALFFAASEGHKAVVELLLEGGANVDSKNTYGRTPLSYAASGGHKAIVELLLERGADGDSKDTDGRTPLSYAAREGHKAVVELLLERGADGDSKDTDGRTPLSYAAREGHKAVVELLLERGADVDSKEPDGHTPLLYAAREGYKAVVELLREMGANVDSKNTYGRTPLSYAAHWGHKAIVELLLEMGADVDSKGTDGRTPLSYAARWGHKAIVELLLERGADVDSKHSDGWTPLSWSVSSNEYATTELLRTHGARDGRHDETVGTNPTSDRSRSVHDSIASSDFSSSDD